MNNEVVHLKYIRKGVKHNGVTKSEKKKNQELKRKIKNFEPKHRETCFSSLRIKTIEIRIYPPAWVYLPFDIRTPEAHPPQDRDLLLGLNLDAIADDID